MIGFVERERLLGMRYGRPIKIVGDLKMVACNLDRVCADHHGFIGLSRRTLPRKLITKRKRHIKQVNNKMHRTYTVHGKY